MTSRGWSHQKKRGDEKKKESLLNALERAISVEIFFSYRRYYYTVSYY